MWGVGGGGGGRCMGQQSRPTGTVSHRHKLCLRYTDCDCDRHRQSFGYISVLVTFQFWSCFSFCDILVLVTFQFCLHFCFGYVSVLMIFQFW